MGVLVVLSFSALPVHANPTDVPGAPGALAGEYDASTHQITLTWLPPDDEEYVYNVYEDAVLLANTTLTNLTANVTAGLHAYWVTAVNDEGVESQPSMPLLAIYGNELGVVFPAIEFLLGGGFGGGCEAFILKVGDHPPFADAVVRQECLPPPPCTGPVAVTSRGSC